jgi:hypothetical protein
MMNNEQKPQLHKHSVNSRLCEIQKAKNIIERNNIMIEIYKDIDCVGDKVNQMRLENIQMQLFLNGC